MRHARFDVATLLLEGIPLTLKAAYLLVAEQDGAVELQWECLAYALDTATIGQGTYALDITTLDGREFAGRAVLVRSVEGAHVLRGDGPLAGVAPSDIR
ncbi:hypothetical protein ACE2AJ_08360 [Aquihabitans daechungensis]|uniref:hypothetical protein n=1 Tax=Aquihabitans daechungensis TaxID=1052257 RepID=UPI003B9EED0A